ncbi:MAG: cupin domain-containing protein [candidate division Zixibacteria bacterium]|nr:cupin domain-containing protein [candidate division Zixibacteria bacterium]
MAQITHYKGYAQMPEPTIPKPDHPVEPNIVTVQQGIPIKYPGCEGIGVRVLHPTNPNAPSKNFSVTKFYVPPHVTLPSGGHENEEVYMILKGKGTMMLAGKPVEVSEGIFIHLPAWCEHGLENTGNDTMEIMICTSPPNP